MIQSPVNTAALETKSLMNEPLGDFPDLNDNKYFLVFSVTNCFHFISWHL
jgi:hypothetical protein